MQPAPLPAALEALDHRLAAILMALRPLIAHHFLRHPWVPNAITVPLWNRIGRYARRLSCLIALFAASNLPRPRTPCPRPAPAHPTEPTRPPHPPIPRRHGWMLAAMGWHVAVYRNRLEILLAEPEMAEFHAAAPGARRLLRPICHMLGVRNASLGVRHASLGLSPASAEAPRGQPASAPTNPPPAAASRRLAATHPVQHHAPAFAPRPVRLLCPRLRDSWPFKHLPETSFE